MAKFTCPKCGSSEEFVEMNTSTNYSTIDYIDADTKEIVWSGWTEYGDPLNRISLTCLGCNHEFQEEDL